MMVILCFSVGQEESDSCQEDSLHIRASSIEKENLQSKIEELCSQLVIAYTKMVSLFVMVFICL